MYANSTFRLSCISVDFPKPKNNVVRQLRWVSPFDSRQTSVFTGKITCKRLQLWVLCMQVGEGLVTLGFLTKTPRSKFQLQIMQIGAVCRHTRHCSLIFLVWICTRLDDKAQLNTIFAGIDEDVQIRSNEKFFVKCFLNKLYLDRVSLKQICI